MNEPVKFKKLSEIAKELNAKLDALHLGQLSAEQIEGLTEQSRELYERLVVLRFKAYTHEVKGTEENFITDDEVPTTHLPKALAPTEPSVVAENTPSIPFSVHVPQSTEKTAEVPSNQVSLMDVIEEVMKEEQPEEKNVEAADTQTQEPEPVFKPDLFASKPVNTPLPGAQESLNDRLAKNITPVESIASKLESTPIPDLKKAISLNQRFQFSKELFKGNNQDYEVTIDRLNTATREEALRQIAALRSKYAWKEDSPVAADFIDLVERRFS